MLNIIYGAKGSGKTQRIIEAANAAAEKSKGVVVYLTSEADHSGAVSNSVRYVDVAAYDLKTEQCLLSFLKGLLAGNYDITDVFVDGPTKFIGADVADSENLYDKIAMIGNDFKVNFTVTVSAEELPDFLRKYM